MTNTTYTNPTSDDTICVREPAMELTGYGSLSAPLYRGSTVVFPDGDAYARRNDRGPDAYSYGLHGTPTVRALETQIAELEGGARALVTPSGLSALVLVLLGILQPDQEVLIPDTVYPPVRAFADGPLSQFGIVVRYYDPAIGGKISSLIKDRTKLVLVESPGSTTMEIQDIPAIVAAAKARGVLVACDNTWATPLLMKPLSLGADFSIQALTKYAGGHSDLLMGSIAVSDYAMFGRLKNTFKLYGLGVSPDDALLVLRGIKTMSIRLRHVGANALRLARHLEGRPEVEAVLHPALESSPGHALWKRDYVGASGVFSIVLKPALLPNLMQALGDCELFSIGASWGGVHSLLAPMDLAGLRTATRLAYPDPVLRISVGLEAYDDIEQDIDRLLERLAA